MAKNKNNALVLLDELINLAQSEDDRYKVEMIARGKGERTLGQSFWVWHLNVLKEEVEQLVDNAEPTKTA
jgi:hypothetical protein